MTEAERLTRLEEAYEYLQRHVTEQDRVILELSDESNRLRRDLAKLRAQLEEGQGTMPDQRPPHY